MSTDKMDNHYQQQLSAWMDGDLPSDEARFLLRRLQHDDELTGRLERWQLCGDVLRGQAQVPAPAGFAERVASAISAEPTQSLTQPASSRPRNQLRKWGGGALAASVAAIALFMVRQQVPEEAPVTSVARVASQSASGNAGNAASGSPAAPAAVLTAASVAVASAPRRQAETSQRRSATRAQQAASRSVASARLPERAVATAAAAAVPVVHAIASAPSATSNQRNPFSNVQISSPAARPWPRAVSPQYPSSSGGFNAGFSSDRAAQTFYPFEPRMGERLNLSPSGPSLQD